MCLENALVYDNMCSHDNKRCVSKRSNRMQHRLQKNADYLEGYRNSIDNAYHQTSWRLSQQLCNKFWDRLRIEHLNSILMRKPWYKKQSMIGDKAALNTDPNQFHCSLLELVINTIEFMEVSVNVIRQQ